MVYVVDTVALISYFSEIFEKPPRVSRQATDIIHQGIVGNSQVLLSIPSIVFIEIFGKFYTTSANAAKFSRELWGYLQELENVEIRPLDREVIDVFSTLDDEIVNLENHDKIVLATAISLECPLLTNDPKIIKYNKITNAVPRIIT